MNVARLMALVGVFERARDAGVRLGEQDWARITPEGDWEVSLAGLTCVHPCFIAQGLHLAVVSRESGDELPLPSTLDELRAIVARKDCVIYPRMQGEPSGSPSLQAFFGFPDLTPATYLFSIEAWPETPTYEQAIKRVKECLVLAKLNLDPLRLRQQFRRMMSVATSRAA